MRWYRGPDGDQRIWFEQAEIEGVMEDELRAARLMPTPDRPVTDLEPFVERHLQSPLDPYAELAADVLGVTEFRQGQRPMISINRDLTGAALDEEDAPPGLRGRWRATLAHEASHVLLHRVLFDIDDRQGSLFPQPRPAGHAMMRCLKRDVGHEAVPSDWREVQANRGMAALLMPRRVFGRVVRAELLALGVSRGALRTGDPRTERLARRLAERFEVSRQAASIRLDTLRFVASAEPLDLPPGPRP